MMPAGAMQEAKEQDYNGVCAVEVAHQRNRVLTFGIEEPFEVALRMLRRALAMEGLRVPNELDTRARVRQELGVALRHNIVLYVDDPVRLLEATLLNPAGGLFVPESVVLATDGEERCVVFVRSLEQVILAELPPSVRSAVSNLHERILAGVHRIALKETAATQMATCGAVAF